MNRLLAKFFFRALLLLLGACAAPTVSAATPAVTEIDDFEDGDAFDWGFFGPTDAALVLTNSIVAGNSGLDLSEGPFDSGALAVVPGGFSIDSDGSCNPGGAGG